MKGLTVLLIALLPLTGLAADLPTRAFERNQLTAQPASAEFGYPGLNQRMYSLRLGLPVQPVLLPLQPHEASQDIRFEVHSSNLGYVPASLLADDETTSDEPIDRSEDLNRQVMSRQLAVQVTGEITLRGERYAELLLLPVTVDYDGRAVFNEALYLSCAGRSVAPADLVSREVLDSYGSDICRGTSTSTAADGAEYIIVTNEELRDAFHVLAEYKTETGIVTEVVLIDDVLAGQTGVDDAEKLRNYLKTFRDRGGVYVLLGGDETVLPIRYAYHYNATSMPAVADLQVCDLYFADLTGNWDLDGDNVWGERYHDQPDIIPELRVGRLPFNRASEVTAYVSKLIEYETDPGRGAFDYLNKAFFYSSDQMRDYGDRGQHGVIADVYPDTYIIDTVSGVEQSSGDDPAPTNLSAQQTVDILSQGFGIVNILAHGASNSFCVRTSQYNSWPKSVFQESEAAALEGNGLTSFYYSLACNNGGFDRDQAPLNEPDANLVQRLLSQPEAGAVGFVAYSRWGWISSSHLLQTAFFESLFAHPGRPAIDAMYDSKEAYYFYRDLIYGQNYYGDPTLVVHTDIPKKLSLDLSDTKSSVEALVVIDGQPVENCRLLVSADGKLVADLYTNAQGQALIDVSFDPDIEYTVSAVTPGACIHQETFVPTLITSVDDEIPDELPGRFALHQNYPNPFNPSTTISFELDAPGRVKLAVYNVLGQEVDVLVDDYLNAGTHDCAWHADGLSSGVYFYRITTAEHTRSKKMILLR